MGRRNRIRHFYDGPDVGAEYNPLCRKRDWGDSRTDHWDLVTCPDCARIIAKGWLTITAQNGSALHLEKYEGPTSYRFLYTAYLNATAVGFIGFEGAYGKGTWFLMPYTIKKDTPDVLDVGYRLTPPTRQIFYGKADEQGVRKSTWTDPNPHTFLTKEYALLAVLHFVQTGELKDGPTTIRKHAEWQVELKRRFEARQSREQAAAEALADTVAGLQAMIERHGEGEIALHNSETAALHDALARLTKNDS